MFILFFFIQNTSHRSFLTHNNYTKHIIHTGPKHETHKTHKNFLVKIYGIHTHNKRNSLQTHDKIILITDLRHKLSDKIDHFTRNSFYCTTLIYILLLPCEF